MNKSNSSYFDSDYHTDCFDKELNKDLVTQYKLLCDLCEAEYPVEIEKNKNAKYSFCHVTGSWGLGYCYASKLREIFDTPKERPNRFTTVW